MSGSSSTNNSWTILTPEQETAAETLRPLVEGTEHHEESHSSAAGSAENTQPAKDISSAEDVLPVEEHLVSEEKKGELSEGSSTDHHTYAATTITDAPVPSSSEASGSSVPGDDALSQSEGGVEVPAQSSTDPDSFSDSYTYVTPAHHEPPASPLSTETLGGAEFTQEEERLEQEGELHPLNEEELQEEGEESEPCPRTTDLGKQADSTGDSEVGDEKAQEGEPEVRRRSLLAALERIGRAEEEEEEEEEAEENFQLPQRDEGSGFSVNKCILGAVILLGLGTIFFSGVFMDLDEESDYNTRELKDTEVPGKQEWLSPEVPPPPVDADSADMLNKVANGNQQISELQAQLQAQKEELKVAEQQAAEGAMERLRWEEVEKENSRLRKQMASLPVLQKENEKMKRELQSVLALQKELKTLRATVTELKLSSANKGAPEKPPASPPSGQPQDGKLATAGSTATQSRTPLDEQRAERKKDLKKEKHSMGDKKEWKEREKSEWKEGEKRERKHGGKDEFKKEKHEQVKFDKNNEGKQKKHNDDKQWKEKDWKKEKASRGDGGKPWKYREGKAEKERERREKSEKKELKEERDWKKSKYEKPSKEKQGRGNEEEKKKDRKGGKDGERKEWKKMKDGFKESGKDKWEKKDWREKGEKNEWKSKTGKEMKGKFEGKEWEEIESPGKWKDERKHESKSDWKNKNAGGDKDWKKKEERKQWEKKEEERKKGQKDKRHNSDWEKDHSNSQKNRDEHKSSDNHHHGEHLWGEEEPRHSHRQPSIDQPEYWVQQRAHLQHNLKPPQHCNSRESCAQAEGLLPVPLAEFQAVLQTYLDKAEEVGVDPAIREELKNLAAEFFVDGVFTHDQISFQEFAEDLSDILEDMVEAEEEEGEEDSAIEEEMEEFEREVVKKFSVPAAGEKSEQRKESGRARG